jgi:hypothetical protein
MILMELLGKLIFVSILFCIFHNLRWIAKRSKRCNLSCNLGYPQCLRKP